MPNIYTLNFYLFPIIKNTCITERFKKAFWHYEMIFFYLKRKRKEYDQKKKYVIAFLIIGTTPHAI